MKEHIKPVFEEFLALHVAETTDGDFSRVSRVTWKDERGHELELTIRLLDRTIQQNHYDEARRRDNELGFYEDGWGRTTYHPKR